MEAIDTNSYRPIRALSVRIHKTDAMPCGEPVLILGPAQRRGYYRVASLSRGDGTEQREVRASCLVRTKQSIAIARKINRKAAAIKEGARHAA